eukprot:3183450-Rhodomonas_salina.1
MGTDPGREGRSTSDATKNSAETTGSRVQNRISSNPIRGPSASANASRQDQTLANARADSELYLCPPRLRTRWRAPRPSASHLCPLRSAPRAAQRMQQASAGISTPEYLSAVVSLSCASTRRSFSSRSLGSDAAKNDPPDPPASGVWQSGAFSMRYTAIGGYI